MTRTLTATLVAFADALPVPRRLIAGEHGGRLTVRIRAWSHRFHRDLPESPVWGYEGTVPGPTIEAERGEPVTVEWRNELEGPLPVVVTTAPEATDADGVSVRCAPGLSGGAPDEHAAALAGHTVYTCTAAARLRLLVGSRASASQRVAARGGPSRDQRRLRAAVSTQRAATSTSR